MKRGRLCAYSLIRGLRKREFRANLPTPSSADELYGNEEPDINFQKFLFG